MEERPALPFTSKAKVEPPEVFAGAFLQCEAPLPSGRHSRRNVTVVAGLALCVAFLILGACFIDLPLGVPAVDDVEGRKLLLRGGPAAAPPRRALAFRKGGGGGGAAAAAAPSACTAEELEKVCSLEADATDRCGQNCSRQSRLQNMLDLTFVGSQGKEWTWENCALVGAGDNMKDAGLGSKIDDHYPIIRINRLPHTRLFGDFGTQTHLVFANDRYIDEGLVALMRQGVPIPCNGRRICSNASLVFRRLEAESNSSACPQDLLRWWGPLHPFLGCTPDLVISLARRLQGLEGLTELGGKRAPGVHTPSTGFVAFLTFAPLCKRMDVFGFPKDSRSTADGHKEFPKHNLEIEHSIERLIAKRDFSAVNVTDGWQDKELRLWRWFKSHVGEITFVGE